jgi:hypothetical protein
MMILSTSISVNARRSTADRSSHASNGSGSSGMAASMLRPAVVSIRMKMLVMASSGWL